MSFDFLNCFYRKLLTEFTVCAAVQLRATMVQLKRDFPEMPVRIFIFSPRGFSVTLELFLCF